MTQTMSELVKFPLTNNQAKLSVIMPAFNEQQHINDNVALTIATLNRMNINHEIVVVDDGSHDKTLKHAKELGKRFSNVKAVGYDKNIGKGYAIKYGFNYSQGEYVAFLDADLDLHPNHFNDLFKYLEHHDADVVIGSKRHPESQINYPWHRKLISNTYYRMIKLLFRFPFNDTQTGIKLFRHEVLDQILPKIEVHKYAFDLEILANAYYFDYKIIEIPVNLDFKRPIGRIRIKDIYHVFLDTLGIYYRLKIRKLHKK